ncbi:hypothetical protein [Clostridium sp. JS66]|uniref:hypothetical protein n=1 Tax=Clostridium sp. JS66 TaxID=3064705 RepID=UPI00298D6DA4|nr:hypothetical protein [Clostridium sp. JS66]WPC42927.1 hypothetical protein Q6H37_05500 [Clostridium sp. JS66]
MKKRFAVYGIDGDLDRKKIEGLFLEQGFIKVIDSMFWGEESKVISIAEQLEKEYILYGICPI